MFPVKTCTKCGQPGEFNKDRSKKDGLRSNCKACEKAHYQANREKQAEYSKAWREANPEKKAELNKAWREANREKHLEQVKAWRKANPDKVREHSTRRRARKAGAAGYHTAQQWQARIDYYGGKCYYCGCDGKMDIEHRIPLSRGGSDWPANLVPACGSCNKRKNTKTEFEYLTLTKPLIKMEL